MGWLVPHAYDQAATRHLLRRRGMVDDYPEKEPEEAERGKPGREWACERTMRTNVHAHGTARSWRRSVRVESGRSPTLRPAAMNENEQKAMEIRSLNEMVATGIPIPGRSSHEYVFLTFARPDVSELHITNSLSCEARSEPSARSGPPPFGGLERRLRKRTQNPLPSLLQANVMLKRILKTRSEVRSR